MKPRKVFVCCLGNCVLNENFFYFLFCVFCLFCFVCLFCLFVLFVLFVLFICLFNSIVDFRITFYHNKTTSHYVWLRFETNQHFIVMSYMTSLLQFSYSKWRHLGTMSWQLCQIFFSYWFEMLNKVINGWFEPYNNCYLLCTLYLHMF